MTAAHGPELVDRDRGLDASSSDYPQLVRAVVLAPWSVHVGRHPTEAGQLAARTVSALNEVARWANDGQAADPTACAWLAYLRWAVAQGAELPSDAPHPPADDFDRQFPLLTRPVDHTGDSFTALATGRLSEVARPVLPRAESPEVLARTAPYGLLPNIGWKSLVALAVDSAAITHGSAEAQTAATAMALTVHGAIRARGEAASLHDVVAATARVCALMTRPAPVTQDLLERCGETAARNTVLDGAATAGGEHAASYALALGLAALLQAEEGHPASTQDGQDVVARALPLLPGSSPKTEAARIVVVTVAAAHWGLEHAVLGGTENAPSTHDAGGNASVDDAAGPGTRAELLALAAQWNARWRP